MSLHDRLTVFIETATVRHDSQYDYSRVHEDFVNAHTKVRIGCPSHGEFRQTPNEHRRGQRCPDCSGRRGSTPDARREVFIARAREIHGDRYDYSRTRYVDTRTPIVVVCRVHGPFEQRPMNHISSHTPSNCLKCADESRPTSLAAAWTTRERPRRDRVSGEFRKAA
jgi:hypothetical protein